MAYFSKVKQNSAELTSSFTAFISIVVFRSTLLLVLHLHSFTLQVFSSSHIISDL